MTTPRRDGLLQRLADLLFGRPTLATDNGHALSPAEFDRKLEEQRLRKEQLEAEVRPWLEE